MLEMFLCSGLTQPGREGIKNKKQMMWRHSLTTSQCWASLWAMSTFPNKTLPFILLLCKMLYVMEHSFGELGSFFLVVCYLLHAPSRKALKLCKHCSTIAKTFVCYQQCSYNAKHSSISPARKRINSIPSRPRIKGHPNKYTLKLLKNKVGNFVSWSW